jgi:hypothetical protein
MHDFSPIFILLSVIVYLIGFIPYIYHVFHGRVVPHPFTWTIGVILVSINTIQLLATDGMSISLVSPLMRIVALMIGVSVGWYYIRKIQINLFDYICLWLAIIVIGIAWVWWVSHAILPTIAIDILVMAPTLKKIWLNPHSEESLAWVTAGLSLLFLLCSMRVYTFESVIFWIYDMALNLGVAIFIIYRTRYMDRWTSRVKSFFASILAFTSKV